MGYKYNGSLINLDKSWRDTAGTQYPSNWLRDSTAADRAAVPSGGVTWEVEPASYDQRFYWGKDKPKDIAKLKTYWIKQQKDTANQLLSETDWLIVRKAEADTAVPSDTTTYRTAVRTKCKEREDQITACSNTDALAILIDKPSKHPEAGTASNGAVEKKKEDGSSHDPKQYEDVWVQDSSALKAWPEKS